MQFPQPGHTFQGKYQLTAELGRGGFAAVYRAVDLEIGRDVAIKILMPNGEGYDSKHAARFMREARVVAQLSDPHTITMFDFGRADDGLLYMVFEFVAGADLSRQLTTHGRLAPATAAHVLEQLLYALREAHAAGVLHRDLKPANVLIYEYMDDPWRVKLLDFGIAKPGIGRNADPIATLTQAGGVVGTPRYMSPEQLCGEPLTPASDIYSLGLLTFEMLVGAPAIDGRDTRDNLRLQLAETPLSFPPEVPVPLPLKAIVERMMARRVEERFSTTAEVLEALRGPRSHSGPQQTRPTGSAPPSTSRRPPSTAVPLQVESPPTRVESSNTPSREPSHVLVAIGSTAAIVIALAAVFMRRDDPPAIAAPAPALRANPLAPVRTSKSVPIVEPAADAPADQPISGCGRAAKPGLTSFKLPAGLSDRHWLTYVPKNYAPNTPHGVVLLMHDRTRSARRVMDDLEFMPVADEHNLILIAPTGRGITNPWVPTEDAKLVKTILARTAEDFCVDPKRRFAVGHHIGGSAVEYLACEIPFSAIATTAFRGTVPLPCTPEPAVPFIHLAGDKSKYQPIKGGTTCEGGTEIPLQAKNEAWRAVHNCGGAIVKTLDLPTGECFANKCEVAYTSCVMHGGRDWPKAEPRDFEFPGCPYPPSHFPITSTIWEFFETNGRDLSTSEDEK